MTRRCDRSSATVTGAPIDTAGVLTHPGASRPAEGRRTKPLEADCLQASIVQLGQGADRRHHLREAVITSPSLTQRIPP